MFKNLDTNGSGFVSVSELRHGLTKTGEMPCTDEEFDDILRDADIDPAERDGQVNYDVFAKMMGW